MLGKRAGGGATTLGSAAATVTAGTWYTLRLEAFGTTLRGFVNGVRSSRPPTATFATGRVGLATSTPAPPSTTSW